MFGKKLMQHMIDAKAGVFRYSTCAILAISFFSRIAVELL